MNNLVLFQQQKTAQKLLCKPPNDFERETTESIWLDELVKIHIQKFSWDAKVASEVETLDKANHAVFVLRVLSLLAVE